MRMMRYVWMVVVLVACGKSKPDYETGSAAPVKKPAAATPTAPSEPAAAATVSGPTRSVAGAIGVSGAMTGQFEWKKQDQRAPIICMWDPDKDLGTFKADLSDGAGHLLTVGIDIPPTDVGPGRLELSSKDLPAPLKTYSSFRVIGSEAEHFSVHFDNTVAVTDPDAQSKADTKKNAEPPPDPHVTLKGTLEVECPNKK
jgi:hypothetical protein